MIDTPTPEDAARELAELRITVRKIVDTWRMPTHFAGGVPQYSETAGVEELRAHTQRATEALRQQLENQAAIIRDTATPANEREQRMLAELEALRSELAEVKAELASEHAEAVDNQHRYEATYDKLTAAESRAASAEGERDSIVDAVIAEFPQLRQNVSIPGSVPETHEAESAYLRPIIAARLRDRVAKKEPAP